MLGIGKSTLGAELASQYNVPPKRKIWLTFRRGLKDKVEAVIWPIGAALAQGGDMRYWNFLERDLELKQHYPFSVKVGLLLHYLEQSPSLLCLDQLEIIENDPTLRSTLVELVDRLHFDSDNPVRLITMGRYIPAFLRDDQSLVLSGLKFDAVVQMVDQENINCSHDVLELLFDKTSGNPYLIKTFLKYTKLQGIVPSLELINAYWDVFISMRAELEDYLIDMQSEQQSMMEALSVFRTVIPSRLFRQEFLIDDDFIPSQGRVMTELIMHSWVQQVGYGQLLRLPPLFRDLWQDKGL